jgi:inorganic triphosphatase YgiF
LTAIPTETEIKLVFRADAAESIKRHFADAARPGRERNELTTYYDADDLLLHRHGFSLRTRKSDGHVVQTLKQTPTGSASVFRRNEWEWNLQDNQLLFPPVRQLLAASGVAGDVCRLKPRIVTEIRRQRFDVIRYGSEIEAAIDEGVVKAGDREEAVHEIELELKHGHAGPAYRIALELLAHYPLRLGIESKADRGYRLFTGRRPAARTARDATVPEHASLKEAMAGTIEAALQGFVANLPATQAGAPEGVHQAHVALRRVRSMLVFYSPCLEPSARERFDNAVREFGVVLGAARDWDVFIDETLCAAAKGDVPANWIAALSEAAEIRRLAARLAVRQKLESKAPAELVLGLLAWIGEGAWTEKSIQISRLRAFDAIPGFLDRLNDKVRRRGRHLSRLPAGELHSLRKSIKKLRYSAESTPELYPRKDVNRFVKACKRLQAVLGAINDAKVTVRLLTEIAPGDSACLVAAAGAVQRWNIDRQSGSRPALEKAWKTLKHADLFWK